MKHTYRRMFSDGATCSISIDAEMILAGKNPVLRMEWSNRPTAGILTEYRDWVLGVMQSAVDAAGAKTVYVIKTGRDSFEPWLLSPNSPRRLLTGHE